MTGSVPADFEEGRDHDSRMTDSRSVRPLTTGFARLARVHVLSAAADTCTTIALAGSLFFNLDPAAARPKVALYLLLTIAPFTVIGPLIGPLIDRLHGGRRAMVLVASIGRALLALLMIR
ncbi:MAG: hypothetical protein P8R36_08010, partial [Actinomycetota bacterium]|nr:hypothetical protein [Actinomycetota bacterium]